MTSNFSALTFSSEATVVSEHGPDAYERATYYNGITGDDEHPELVYRSDYLTTPFPSPLADMLTSLSNQSTGPSIPC